MPQRKSGDVLANAVPSPAALPTAVAGDVRVSISERERDGGTGFNCASGRPLKCLYRVAVNSQSFQSQRGVWVCGGPWGDQRVNGQGRFEKWPPAVNAVLFRGGVQRGVCDPPDALIP